MVSSKIASKCQAWFCSTGLPSDIIVELNGMSFHLHKFPLMSKSRRIHDLIREWQDKSNIQEEEEPEATNEIPHILLPSFPGGTESFEAIVKLCYGVELDLTATNAATLRCAAEYLEMTDEFTEQNLVSRTERFLA